VSVKIGVLGLQGDIEEHIEAWSKASNDEGFEAEVSVVKHAGQLTGLKALSVPGGESTVMGSLAERTKLLQAVKESILDGLPVFGTCAGMILLSKHSKDSTVTEKQQPLLGVLDVEVERNHFGRQPDSFETFIKIDVLGAEPYKAVFIRAPVVKRSGPTVKALAELEDGIVAVRQGNILATAFHPELSSDTRLHRYFLRQVATVTSS
jgi:5'-phosphate synthase pdxT subunit